jgi:hypothetical protein
MTVEIPGDVVTALIAALESDSDLRTVVGHDSRMVYRDTPDTETVIFPCLTVEADAVPISSNIVGGILRASLSIDLLAETIAKTDELFGYLVDHWSIPAKRAGQLDSTAFRIKVLSPLNCLAPVPLKRVADGKLIRLRPTLWQTMIVRIS